MLPDILSDYLDETETTVQSLKDCHIEKYQEEILSANRVNLRIRIRFSKGCLLELNESVVIEHGKFQHLSYRYHFQDKNNKLLFRYDNTPHFPDLESFPHHKHLPTQVIPVVKPSITEVIAEAKKLT
ncbi:MAG: toxin TumE [bacterium]